jgi:putative proteasome-type protease
VTFCLGMRVGEGLVGIADTRVTSGTEVITARKVSVHEHGGRTFFLMTSGLRSLRDKALTYFEEILEASDAEFDKLYKAVNAFSKQLRRVAEEDKEALTQGSYRFDLHALIGGQLRHDKEHKLYLIYPQGNWVEIGAGTPYCIIGESGYGKPILDRTLKFTDTIRYALKVGCLAFDSTRISAANVDFPIDVIIYEAHQQSILEHRYEKKDLLDISNWWQERLRQSVVELPYQWQEAVLGPELPQQSQTIRMPTGTKP